MQNTVVLEDVSEILKLKEKDGPALQVHGNGDLIQTLLKHDLVDEMWLKIFPVTLGNGKKYLLKGQTLQGSSSYIESLTIRCYYCLIYTQW